MKNIVAVILAAGRGTRMHPFSEYYPKPGLPICNTPLIEYSLRTFKALGIEQIHIVIGHLGHELVRMLGDGAAYGVRIKYVEQTKLLGIAAALGQMEPYIASPFFLVLGDIFFKTEDLSTMTALMRDRQAGGVLAVKHERDPAAIRRNFAVRCADDGRVTRVIEKPRYVDTTLKGCGLYLFDLPIFDAVRRTPRTAMRDEYEITDAVQIMIDDGLPVYPAEVIRWDVNLTSPGDVLQCNLFELRNRGLSTLIGRDARIHPDARLENVVVGDRAVISQPIRLRDCVIFPDTEVRLGADVERFVFTPEHQIDCRLFNTVEID